MAGGLETRSFLSPAAVASAPLLPKRCGKNIALPQPSYGLRLRGRKGFPAVRAEDRLKRHEPGRRTMAHVADHLIPTRVKADSFRGFQTGASQTLWGEQEVRHAARDCASP